jgi:hypothetical protein
MKPHFIEVKRLPDVNDTKEGEYFEIIDPAGLWWGAFKSCRNWVGEKFYLPCDPQGKTY